MGNIKSCQRKQVAYSIRKDSPVEHVLMIQELLRIILDYLSYRDLLKIRVVSSVWKRVADELLALKCPGILLCLRPLKPHEQYIIRRAKHNNSYQLPYTKFFVIYPPDQNNIFQSTDLHSTYTPIKELYKIVTRSASSLTIALKDNNKKIWSWLGESAEYSRLRSLKLETYYTNNDSMYLESIKYFVGVVKTAPCLDTLILKSQFSYIRTDRDYQLTKTFLELLNFPEIRKIRHLTLPGLDLDRLSRVKELDLQLATLSVTLKDEKCIVILKEILGFQGNLKTLEIGLPKFSTKSDWFVWLPYLQQVKTLKLFYSFVGKETMYPHPDFVYNTEIKSPNKLELFQNGEVVKVAGKGLPSYLNNVTGLKMPRFVGYKNDELALLSDLIPACSNLRDLEIWDSSIKRFAGNKQMQNLKLLTIRGSFNAPVLEEMLTTANNWGNEFFMNFKNLETLKIKHALLTDTFCNIITEKWKLLRQLDLWDSPKCIVSQSMVQYMRDHFSVSVQGECITEGRQDEITTIGVFKSVMRYLKKEYSGNLKTENTFTHFYE